MTKLMFVNEGSSQESYTNNLKFNITGFKKKAAGMRQSVGYLQTWPRV